MGAQEQTVLNYSNYDLDKVITPVDVDAYEQLLKASNYDQAKSEELIQGFRHGFEIGYAGPPDVKLNSPNLKLRVGDEVDLWNKVMKEVKLKRYAGPFEKLPFDSYIQSPIGLVQKDEGKDTRLIFHLSYPRNGKKQSVNANTPTDLCKVKCPDFNEAIASCLLEG